MTADAEQAAGTTLDIEQDYSEEHLDEMFGAPAGIPKRLWHTGPTFRNVGDQKAVGYIGAGIRRVESQKNFPNNRVDFRGYWNTWWVLAVRDDLGNQRVWVSAVFFKEGANGKPVPGIPIK